MAERPGETITGLLIKQAVFDTEIFSETAMQTGKRLNTFPFKKFIAFKS